MESFVSDWINLALRWFHVIAGISWIGSSFYFMWLDASLEPPPKKNDPSVEGQLWMVHSGGFYRVEKKKIQPGKMPQTLHWFKWEAALTWLSGIALLTLIYYSTNGLFLTDPSVSNISANSATLLGIGLLVGCWFVYDGIWISPLGKRTSLATAICVILLVGLIYGLCQVFSGRGAYIHVGAILGTIMVANVWQRILPAQQQMIDATRSGKKPNYELGTQAKRRSVHNSYVTFPVIFIMLSHHYPLTYGNPLNWLILALFMVLGGGVRHFMIARSHSSRSSKSGLVIAGASLLILFMLTLPKSNKPTQTSSRETIQEKISFTAARAIIKDRCVSCHSANPSDQTFGSVPAAGISFDSPEMIKAFAPRIKERVIINKTMPLGNKTQMTEEERNILARWIEEGASL